MIAKACIRPPKCEVRNFSNLWMLPSSRGYYRVVTPNPHNTPSLLTNISLSKLKEEEEKPLELGFVDSQGSSPNLLKIPS